MIDTLLLWVILIGAYINILMVGACLFLYTKYFPWQESEAGPYLKGALFLLLLRHLITVTTGPSMVDGSEVYMALVIFFWNLLAGIGEAKLLLWLWQHVRER